jgi:hypothetical protein
MEEEKEICKCKCHQDGKLIDHTGKYCCSHPDKKYISASGEVDQNRYIEVNKDN